jgi:hypothetical protein
MRSKATFTAMATATWLLVSASARAQAPEEHVFEREGAAPESAAPEHMPKLAEPSDPPPQLPLVEDGVPVPGGAPDLSKSSSKAGSLRNLRLVQLREGEAEVTLIGARQTLRPGDAIGEDVVRRVDTARIVLGRPEAGGAEATVLVTFDAKGQARVRIYTTRDSTALEAPPVQR